MMKSWADHCSSDEEDSVDDPQQHEEQDEDDLQPLSEEMTSKLQVDDGTGGGEGDQQQGEEKTYDFPEHPPYTAFVGNLAFSIKEVPQLVEAVANLAQERLGEAVNVMGGRIAYHRTGDQTRHRGFGYVEVETLEEVSFIISLSVLMFVELYLHALALLCCKSKSMVPRCLRISFCVVFLFVVCRNSSRS
jgi:hypothetical protein